MAHEEGQGTASELVAVVSWELGSPPDGAVRAMAWVLDGAGGADHIGLRIGDQPSPGGLDLLAGVIPARARPQATLLLEWTCAGDGPGASRRHYRGWAVQQEPAGLRWRRLSVETLRAQVLPGAGGPLGVDPLARCEGAP